MNRAEYGKVQKSIRGQSVMGPLTSAPVAAASLNNGPVRYWVNKEPNRDFVWLRATPNNGPSLPILAEFGPLNWTHPDKQSMTDCTGKHLVK